MWPDAGVREMAQSGEYFLQKREDLNSVSRRKPREKAGLVARMCNPSPRRWRQEDPWNSPNNQPSSRGTSSQTVR